MNRLFCIAYMYIIEEQQTEVINIKCYHDNLHPFNSYKLWLLEEYIFITLLAGAPSLGKFPYSINVLPTKRWLFSVTLVWSPYVYSPWLKQWFEPSESAPKRPKTQRSAGKVMASVFWNAHGAIFIDYLKKGRTITGTYYGALLDRLVGEIRKKRPHLKKKIKK